MNKETNNKESLQARLDKYLSEDPKKVTDNYYIQLSPVVKWAGGKRRLVKKYQNYFPNSFNTYYEPFFGGGALFFHLYSESKIDKAILADINEELINLYKVIRNDCDKLISELESGRYYNEKKQYYKIRAEKPTNNIVRAARLLYLNHTCFNGLYRVNKKGEFNVPYGRYPKNVKIYDKQNLCNVSKCLQTVKILNCDFEKAVETAEKGDFIYFDPPYAPISATSDFTSYTAKGFGYKDQKRLAELFRKLDDRGCYVMESNSSAPLIFDLYEEYKIRKVKAKRYINSDPNGRKGVFETLIVNF